MTQPYTLYVSPLDLPGCSWIPGVGSVFMMTWKTIKDRSYTTDLWRAIASNDVAILGRRLNSKRGQYSRNIVFRFDDVNFHSVSQNFVDAYLDEDSVGSAIDSEQS